MSSFALQCRQRRVASLATFGDSITAGLAATTPERRWSNLLAAQLGAPTLYNRGIGGTVVQSSPMADGQPRPGNGHSRYRRDLLGAERGDVLAILYGFNDARYVGAPETFNHAGFVRDFRAMLSGLREAGYAAASICLGSPPHLPDAGFAVGSPGFAGQSRELFQAYVPAIRALAREFGTYYAPVNERMGAEGGDALIAPDHVHPNDRGHAKIAEIFAAATRLG